MSLKKFLETKNNNDFIDSIKDDQNTLMKLDNFLFYEKNIVEKFNNNLLKLKYNELKRLSLNYLKVSINYIKNSIKTKEKFMNNNWIDFLRFILIIRSLNILEIKNLENLKSDYQDINIALKEIFNFYSDEINQKVLFRIIKDVNNYFKEEYDRDFVNETRLINESLISEKNNFINKLNEISYLWMMFLNFNTNYVLKELYKVDLEFNFIFENLYYLIDLLKKIKRHQFSIDHNIYNGLKDNINQSISILIWLSQKIFNEIFIEIKIEYDKKKINYIPKLESYFENKLYPVFDKFSLSLKSKLKNKKINIIFFKWIIRKTKILDILKIFNEIIPENEHFSPINIIFNLYKTNYNEATRKKSSKYYNIENVKIDLKPEVIKEEENNKIKENKVESIEISNNIKINNMIEKYNNIEDDKEELEGNLKEKESYFDKFKYIMYEDEVDDTFDQPIKKKSYYDNNLKENKEETNDNDYDDNYNNKNDNNFNNKYKEKAQNYNTNYFKKDDRYNKNKKYNNNRNYNNKNKNKNNKEGYDYVKK